MTRLFSEECSIVFYFVLDIASRIANPYCCSNTTSSIGGKKWIMTQFTNHILVGLILFTVSSLILIALAPTGKKNSGVIEKIVR